MTTIQLFKGSRQNISTDNKPNSVIDAFDGPELFQRRFFGRTSTPRTGWDYTAHGNSVMHPVVPHAHNWTLAEKKKGKLPLDRDSKWRELTKAEQFIKEWSEKNGYDE